MNDNKKAILKIDGKEISLPIITGSESENGIDISSLRKETGYITLDPGYANTGACKSDITFIDGETGILRYRGYPIENLAGKVKFTDVAYLLINGELPTVENKLIFSKTLRKEANIHEDMKRFFDGFPLNAHPMATLSSMVIALSAFNPVKTNDEESINDTMIKILAKVKTIAAYSYRKYHGLPFIYPNPELNYVENFLHMMFSDSQDNFHADKVLIEALDLLLILHADHEQNCSTSTVRMAGSSMSNIYGAVSSGISALWGPLHGGANQAVLEMLEVIKNDNCDYKKYINLAKDKNSEFRLMGFGHRVYKNYDPRAKIISEVAEKVLNTLKIEDPLLDIARSLEEVALKDEYFISRKLYPNVDFYSGIIYRAMGIPTNMFTVMFALGRLPGWLAHWNEMINSPDFKINRPRQIYTGSQLRNLK
jgi:citrate synthase